MAHNHNIVDTDSVFIIDPITRMVTNEFDTKITLMQFDHNSERATFRMPQTREGHDMLKSDVVQIHFINTGTGTSVGARATKSGMYPVKDLREDPDNPGNIMFSWLISEATTQLAGSVTFVIKFICYESTDGNDDASYKWHTYPCSLITVMPGMNTADNIVEVHPDIILDIERRLDAIPDVTDIDNGKILHVKDGKVEAAAIADTAVKTYIDDYISSALGGDY